MCVSINANLVLVGDCRVGHTAVQAYRPGRTGTGGTGGRQVVGRGRQPRLTLASFHLQLPADIVIQGLISGCVYGLFGVGLALVYRSTRVINFAHGETGALGAKLLLFLVLNQRLSYWIGL